MSVEKRLFLAFGLALALLGGLMAAAVRGQQTFVAANERALRAAEAIDELDDIPALVAKAEGSLPVFFMTRDERLLSAYEAAVAQLPAKLEAARRLMADNPRQQQRLGDLEPAIGRKLAELREALALWRQGGSDATRQALFTLGRASLTETIRAVVGLMEGEERTFLPGRADMRSANARLTEVFLLGGVLGMITLALAGLKIRRDIRAGDQSKAALLQSERQFRNLVQALPVSMYACDAAGRVTIYNQAAITLWGREPNVGEEMWTGAWKILKTDGRPFPLSEIPMAVAMRERRPVHGREIVVERPDGSRAHVLPHPTPLFDADGNLTGGVNMLLDLTGRIQAEERIRRLNRTHSVLSEINQLIMRERDPQIILDSACRVAVERGGFRAALVGFVEAPGHVLKLAARAGAQETLAGLDELVGDPRHACPFTTRMLAAGVHAIGNDIEREVESSQWRNAVLQRECRALVSLPLKADEKVVGAFNLYAAEAGFFDAEEMRLLDELADDIGFALELSRREANRRKVEEELHWRTAFFEAHVNSAQDGILVVDNQGKKIIQNQRLSELWGIPKELAEGQDDAAQLRFAISRTKNPREFAEKVAYLYAHPDEVSWDEIELQDGTVLERYSSPVRDQVGKHYGRIWNFRDISARKRLQESLARLAMAVDQSAETIVITDIHGAIIYVNPAFETTTGHTRAEALGQNSNILKSGEHDAEFYRRMWTTLGRGETWSGHLVNRRKDGALYEEEASISPIRDATGATISYVAVKRDVTREMRLEAQLRQSQKMESLGQLAGGVAHDFNNILAAMMMQAELAGMVENTPEEVREGLREIYAAIQRAANLTRQLLLFSRQQAMQPRRLDLNEVVSSLAKMLQRVIREDVSLQLRLHPTPLLILADSGMLDQLLMNLAVNARDAMPGGGRLTIDTDEKVIDPAMAAQNPEASAGRFACLTVSDTGCGMTPEIQSRIFEPFFTTKEAGKGTGLGLATVFGIVKQHRGWVKVRSEVGKGTTFQVFLPALDIPSGEAPASAQQKPKARGGSETILVAEDDASVRMLTRVVLAQNGYHVLEATDGIEALRVWAEQRGRVALLLTDLVMPGGVDGPELAARLQSQNPGLKVIFISGYSADIAGRDLKLKAAQVFIQKPYAANDLLESVRNALDQEP